jgi:aspartate carbamoyltransferase catalytic subunit
VINARSFLGRDVITVGDFRREEILFLLDAADRFEEVTGTLLAGRVVATLFFEPSTRTRLSFESAVGRLGGSCIGFAEAGVSSKAKGENLADTVRVVEGYSDLLLLRHPREGAARLAAEFAKIPVVNCGDGAHQHPTQTFVDLYTIRRECGRLDGLHIVFAGDLRFGRAAHSLVSMFAQFDTKITLVSPPFLRLPQDLLRTLERRGVEFREMADLEASVPDADVLYMTRIQQERFTDPAEYEKFRNAYTLDLSLLRKAREDVTILHPLPRVTEIAPEVDTHPHAAYFRQAHYGVAVRKALLALLLGAAEKVLG